MAEKKQMGKGLSALLENRSRKAPQRRKKTYDEDKLYRKNIDLPGSAMVALEELAAADKRKLKPFLEKVLIELATELK